MIRWWLALAFFFVLETPRGTLYNAEKQAAVDALGKKDAAGYRDALLQLHADFPGSSRVTRNLAAAESAVGNHDRTLEMLRLYAAMGGTLDLASPAWAGLRETVAEIPELARNAAAITHGSRAFRLNDPGLLVEDITYDPDGRRFYLSSVLEHKILSCDSTGGCEDFIRASPEVPLDSVFALCVDAPRHILWATTADMQAGKSALWEFDLRTRKLLHRIQPEDHAKHTMGDMTVAANGDLFVSDGVSGDVYTVARQGHTLEKLAPAGVLLSPQTPALSADGKLLYVPDYVTGIAVIRLADRHIEWLESTIPAALEGIDGLYRIGDRFLAVQNGIQPQRLAELHLDSRGRVDKMTVLEANWVGLGQPTHGVQVGRDFYFIVNSGWDRLPDGGAFQPGDPAELWKLPL